MEIYTMEATVEGGGQLRLDRLPFATGQRLHVELSPVVGLDSDWPLGYFAETFGSIQDETFERAPQGEFEAREQLP